MTSSGATVTPKRRASHADAASRRSSVPIDGGYPVAPGAASRSAASAISGIGSTGVPTEQSTTPPGSASARRRSVASRSWGYGGGTKPGPGAAVGAIGGSHYLWVGKLTPDRRSADEELSEPAELGVWYPGPDPGRALLVDLDEDLAVTVQCRDHVAAVVRDRQLDDAGERAQPGRHLLEQLVHAFARHRGDGYGVRVRAEHGVDLVRCREILLVRDDELRDVRCLDLA